MRILVVGAGVVGTIYGWVLSGAGHDVTHLVRPGRSARLAHGVVMDMLDRRKGRPNDVVCRYHMTVTEAPGDGPYDLVVVPTKPYQLVDALRQLEPQLGPRATYLLLTQNWQGTEQIDQILPRDRYLFGDAQAGGTLVDGALIGAIFPKIVLGRVDGGRDDELDRIAAVFDGAGIRVRIPENILHAIWIQYAINAGLWPPMVRAGGLRPLLHDRTLGRASLLAAAECLRVVAARGVDLRRHREARLFLRTSSRLGRAIAAGVMRALFRFNKAVVRTSAHALADPLEVASAYQEVMATGHRLGVDMRVMASFEPDIHAFASAAR
jgi:2-dehydropantoate 2-reductase